MRSITIRKLRHELGWTQTQLASHLGVSQPLVSAWEAGTRTPRGPAEALLAQLAAQAEVPTAAAPQRPREALLEQTLHTLAAQADDADLAAQMADYQRRMATEVERLVHEAKRRREPRPRLWAYLQQARNSAGSLAKPDTHRAAMRTFLASDGEAAAGMRKWYAHQMQQVLDEARTEDERLHTQLLLIAVDAMWFLDLIGLATWSASERTALVAEAVRSAHHNRRRR